MGLPLVRRQGYRFVTDTPDSGPQLLAGRGAAVADVAATAAQRPDLPVDRLRSLMVKLPYLFPLHLRPLVAKTLEAAERHAIAAAGRQEIFAALAEALLRKSYVKLHYPTAIPCRRFRSRSCSPRYSSRIASRGT